MQKITRKSIFSNLLKLVFITLFVGVFSQIFGTNNSLTWVCVLIGTMMYWYMDIGINIKQAPFVIVLMFLQIGFSNKLAQINPVIGLIVNFITILCTFHQQNQNIRRICHFFYVTFLISQIPQRVMIL